MARKIKIKATAVDDVCNLKARIAHPMKVASKDKKTGEEKPAHFIQQVTVEHKGEVVMSADWGGSVAANPTFSCEFTGAAVGDPVKVSWSDNMGESGSAESKIKKGRKKR